MLPPASDGQDAPPLRPTDDEPDRPSARVESDVLSGLVRMVTERAGRLRDAPVAAPRRMEALREAVDALGHVLDALALLREDGIVVEDTGGATADRPSAASSSLPSPPSGDDASPAPAPVGTPREPPAAGFETGADALPREGPPAEAPASPDPGTDAEPEAGAARSSPVHAVPTGPRLEADPVPEEPAPPSRSEEPGEGDRRYPAFRDSITGLLSREGFEWIASGELKRCARHGRVFTILLLQPGATGAEALEPAADLLRRVLRGSDVAGREGERTVAVALPETAQREARSVGERIIGALESAGVWTREGRIGMAGYPTHGETVWSLLETARGKLSLPVGNVLQRGGDGGYGSG